MYPECEAIDMVLKLVPKGEVPTCTNPIPRLSSEDGFVTMQYECACDYDKQRVRRGNRCIPIAECNDCILDNGDARKVETFLHGRELICLLFEEGGGHTHTYT